MNTKAQIKFGETIGILFIVYLVLMFGIMWYNDKNSDDIDELYVKDAQDRALEKYYFILYSDLLKSSQQGFQKNTFDMVSLIAFSNYSKSSQGFSFLQNRLGEGVITLKVYDSSQKIYEDVDAQSSTLDFQELVLYNNSPVFRENSQLLRKQVFTSLIPVTDQREGKDKTNVGVLRVEVPFYE